MSVSVIRFLGICGNDSERQIPVPSMELFNEEQDIKKTINLRANVSVITHLLQLEIDAVLFAGTHPVRRLSQKEKRLFSGVWDFVHNS